MSRQRSRIACEPCRERKRKCDGDGSHPCNLCSGFGYDCHYRSVPRRRRTAAVSATPKTIGATTVPSASTQQNDLPTGSPTTSVTGKSDGNVILGLPGSSQCYVRSVESNSGAAFMRKLAMAIDPSDAPPLQLLAWNLFLGERLQSYSTPIWTSLTDVVSLAEMRTLAQVYFEKVDCCYGFIERSHFDRCVDSKWSPESSPWYDAVLCGVAALGCLFSTRRAEEKEAGLVYLAKSILEREAHLNSSIHDATGWLLRTVYLRLTARPEDAWIASCTTMHIIDAAGVHSETPPSKILRPMTHESPPDTRRRVFGVAQHMNIWMSFDLARSRVVLQNATTVSAVERPNNFTTELLELLPYSEILDPAMSLGGVELSSALAGILQRFHTEPPSVLAQCNLTLCIYRRLYGLKWEIPPEILDKALALIERGLQAVHAITVSESPWHQAANVPFQAICALLTIDSANSLALLGDTIAILVEIDQVYQTKATREALFAARSLVYMHQKRREADVKKQADMLKFYPATTVANDEEFIDFLHGQSLADFTWFNDFANEVDFMAPSDGFLDSSAE
ncbi:Hypothetical protein R9X50_00173700 [Acrodontium crateriforme]|uniref:Zn(2)-C6 fungal-type domain-containing protein n=1 Tax=Acrodontium crateriforme TaxID=150365 RepID=A0AAQ3R833_9PEZI|nr:Hypothetical protein R9X50_00173700 [Acrodontium crateriforme]